MGPLGYRSYTDPPRRSSLRISSSFLFDSGLTLFLGDITLKGFWRLPPLSATSVFIGPLLFFFQPFLFPVVLALCSGAGTAHSFDYLFSLCAPCSPPPLFFHPFFTRGFWSFFIQRLRFVWRTSLGHFSELSQSARFAVLPGALSPRRPDVPFLTCTTGSQVFFPCRSFNFFA